ncbi:hemerythrin domain-containing protein [Streptomyces sp. WZ-12]|uniref:hemerythrin domain-containing protein n=1 Tax=Streptomyces sp. WZ-12 TaxID=3030210 RepID=UPI002380F197|nr:hemerythrin domain-containing protein [Streptomyces sp. WZ-12]
MRGDPDVVDELTADHRIFDALLAQFNNAPPGTADRKRLVNVLTIELKRHLAFQEQHLPLALPKHLDHSDALATQKNADHSRMRHLLEQLQEREPDDADFDHLVDQVHTQLRTHIDTEENHLFPQLRLCFHPYVLDNLAKKYRRGDH